MCESANFLLENLQEILVLKSGNTACKNSNLAGLALNIHLVLVDYSINYTSCRFQRQLEEHDSIRITIHSLLAK